MKRVMVDLETFGSNNDACIVQIGACEFTVDSEIGPRLRIAVDAADSVKNGAIMDAETIYWWLGQSEDARKSVRSGSPRLSEETALHQLNGFLRDADEVWSHATFDFVIIMGALRRHGIKPLFSHRAARDIRTLNALATVVPGGYKELRQGVHHDALDDAIYQAQYVGKMLKSLGQV